MADEKQMPLSTGDPAKAAELAHVIGASGREDGALPKKTLLDMSANSDRPNKVYTQYVCSKTPRTHYGRRLIWAFLVGGLICCIGQAVGDFIKFLKPSIDVEQLGAWVSVIMIFLGSTLTGLGLYDDIGRFAGAGSIVPITGFANSVVSPAIEFKTEGLIYGMESKMFFIAGPIIVSGVVASVAVGLIYFVIGLF